MASGVSVTFASTGSTYATGGLVQTIDVGAGGLFDLNGNAVSTATGTGLIKNGAGVFGTGAGAFVGGFTLNGGTVIARGTTGLGSGATNTLTLNGGTIASNGNRDFANTRFGGGITIGGNVQFGELVTNVSIASSTANLSFANNVGLGSVTRIFTQGNSGTNTFSGIISNTSGGINFAANAGTDGRFDLTNTANTFTGDININGGEVRFTVDGSMGNAANDIIIDGGRFAKASDSTTVTLGAGRTLSIGDGVGTAISSPGAGVLIYNGSIANKTSETGSWAKQGGGTLELGGASTYTGNTAVNNGILRLTTGNDRLPTGTVVSVGQAASINLGTLDLNGRNQQIAGLNSTTGLNVGASNNTVTSTAAATLTIDGAGNSSYGDGTNENSGVITGAISLVKQGAGTQTLGDANTYTGTTTINGGILEVNGSLALGSAVTVNSGGTLAGKGTVSGTVTVKSDGIVGPGNSPGTLTTGAASFENDSIFSWELNNNLDGDTLDAGDTGIRGTNYDGLTSTSLTVASGAIFRVVLTGTAAIGDLFWDQNQSWTNIFAGTGSFTEATPGQLFNDFQVFNGITDFTLASAPEGNFKFSGSTLTWTAVPEPTSALVGLLITAGLLRRRRVG